jgi:acyl carrier protein
MRGPDGTFLARPTGMSLGMQDASGAIEPRIRRIVAECLGVTPGELCGEASLADELAVDSLDLLEIAIAIEAELGITLAERRLEAVRSYGDLVALVGSLVVEARPPATISAPAVLARVVQPEGAMQRGSVQRALLLTPYAAETVAEEALHAGPGAYLEIRLRGRVAASVIRRIRALFARLVERGVPVHLEPESLARVASSRPAA